ncbi:MAG: hydrolase [Thermotogaceae bacterium]|jgi:inner membrane protein|nr:metal-dependent hydrolase [Mesotoga sp.]NLX34824.1 hydrolase [Thermotogaceae bacterium]
MFPAAARSSGESAMPDFKTHVTWGLFSYPVYMLVAMLIIEIAKLPIIVDSRIIGTGYLLYILGSDLPDIDSKQALIKRTLEVMIAGVVSSIIYSSLISPKIQPILLSWIYSLPVAVTISFSMAIICGIVTSKILDLLSHRGFFHTIWAGLLYGAIVLALLLPRSGASAGNFSYTEIGFLSLAGTTGYFLHLLLDRVETSRKKRKRALSVQEKGPQ